MASLKKANLRRSWETSWAKSDFSWQGLLAKTAPEGGSGKNCQAFWRKISSNQNDEALTENGVLIECKNGKLYHVMYIPQHWISKFVEDPEKFFANRAEIFKKYNTTVQNIETSTVFGMSFYEKEDFSFVSKVRRFNKCFISSNLDIVHKKHGIWLRDVFVDGNLENSRDFPANFVLDVSGSYICGSIIPHAIDGYWVDVRISQSRVAEAIKIIDAGVRAVNISKSTIGSITISNCKIENSCALNDVAVPSGLTFNASDFAGHVSLHSTEIDSFARFIDCDFDDRVVFRDVVWPSGKVTSAFTTGSRFKELVTFTSRNPPPIQLFDGGKFEANVGFDSRYHGKWRSAFEVELKSQDFDDQKALMLASKLENATRNLRNLAQDRGDGPMEHVWHRAEIISRRRTSSVRGLEKGFSNAYGWFADYGLSIGRPFFSLFVIVVLLGATYGYFAGHSWFGRLDWESLEQGLGFSLHQSLPLGVFDDTEDSWRQKLLGQSFTMKSLFVRAIATLQTIVSAVLIYLGVMAIRRKFKIN